MSIDDLRSDMVARRQRAEYDAKAVKDTYVVIDRLRQFYRELDEPTRRFANQIIAEWVTSPDESVRFDAVLLVNEFRIVEAMPALHALALRLPNDTNAGAPYELKKVVRAIEKLADLSNAR